MILPDVLRPGLDLVLCGTAPSLASKQAAAYYAHPGNIFWKTLHQVGLTPWPLAPADYALLPDFGIGLTDLNKTEWGADADLTAAAHDVAGFRAKIAACRPKVVAFTSKQAARVFSGRARVEYGPLEPYPPDIRLFVLPSPSGRARGYFRLKPWQDLAALVASLRDG